MAMAVYLTRDDLPPGYIRLANWGPRIAVDGGLHPLFEREQTFERVRRAVAPRTPSRLASTFAYASIVDALRLGLDWYGNLYSVTFDQSAIPTFRADLGWIERYKQGASAADREAIAAGYWSGGPAGRDPLWELVIGGPFTIVERMLPQEAFNLVRQAIGNRTVVTTVVGTVVNGDDVAGEEAK